MSTHPHSASGPLAEVRPAPDRIPPEAGPPSGTPPPAALACPVCGCPEVHTDEVADREVLLLAECPRCRQRWTRPLDDGLGAPGMVSVRRPRRVPGEVVSAA